jgi:hypothetical protein
MKKTNLKKIGNLFIVVMTTSIIIISLNSFKGASFIKRYNHKITTIDSTVIGTWILDSDTTYKVIFIDEHTCNRYNSNVLFETDSVIIASTAPLCGITISDNPNTTYMTFINKADTTKHYCFEITGLGELSFAYRSIDMGPILLFYRP